MTNTRDTLDSLIQADEIERARRVPKGFDVVRYAIKVKRNERDGSIGTPMYNSMQAARAAAREDNRTFSPPSGLKTEAVAIHLTDRVIMWAENIAHASQAKNVSVAQIQKSILELVQFVQRGY